MFKQVLNYLILSTILFGFDYAFAENGWECDSNKVKVIIVDGGATCAPESVAKSWIRTGFATMVSEIDLSGLEVTSEAIYNQTFNPRQKEYPNQIGFNDLHIQAVRHVDPKGDNSRLDIIVHHHCKIYDDNTQACLLFPTGMKDQDKPHGFEYIITAEQFNQLPTEEQELWHYHKTEIPRAKANLPDLTAEEAGKLLPIINETYGKVFYFWQLGDEFPTGEASILMVHELPDFPGMEEITTTENNSITTASVSAQESSPDRGNSLYNTTFNPRQKEYPNQVGFNDLHIQAVRHVMPDDGDNSKLNVIVHHHCKIYDDNTQACLLFPTGMKDQDKPYGMEYIITTEQFNTLSEEEQKLWHYHKTEIPRAKANLPDLTAEEAEELLPIINETYGKVFYFWQLGNEYPVGQPSILLVHELPDF